MLSIKSLSFQVGETSILKEVELAVSAGENIGIIGPNGSGKTTLFNCISGFVRPSSGAIFFNARDITRLSPSNRAILGLGRVFQNFGIFRDMTLEENILLALESKQGLTLRSQKKQNRALLMEFLSMVGLEAKRKDKSGSLSGGQMRLLEISRAIAFGADLFLLDEPTAGVSPKMKQDILAALHMLRELNKTILVIEHDMTFIEKLCERILVLDSGQIVMDGAPAAVRADPRLQEIYFGGNNGIKIVEPAVV